MKPGGGKPPSPLSSSTNRTRKHMNVEPCYFKTPREIELEQKLADMERALYRAKYGGKTDIAHMPECTELIRVGAAPPRVTLPLVASINCEWDKQRFPRHLKVAARVTVPRSFGVNYYCDAGLISDNAIAAQVLAINHERFVRQLAEFVQMENAQVETSPQ
jgi:hypothetical protein